MCYDDSFCAWDIGCESKCLNSIHSACFLVWLSYVASRWHAALLVLDGACIIHGDKENVVHNNVLWRTCSVVGPPISAWVDLCRQKKMRGREQRETAKQRSRGGGAGSEHNFFIWRDSFKVRSFSSRTSLHTCFCHRCTYVDEYIYATTWSIRIILVSI